MSQEKKGKKKSSAKTTSRRGAKSASTQISGSSSNGPFYVLVIIILITVIVLLLNKFYEKGELSLPHFKSAAEKTEPLNEKKELSKDNAAENKTPWSAGKDKTGPDKVPSSTDKKSDMQTGIKEKDVVLFFLKLDEKSEKIYLSNVRRKLPDKQLLSVTLEHLIKGPTSSELNKGYITAVPPNLKIRGIEIKGKTAEIDFNSAIEEGAAGDILLKRIQQIVNTATQFDDIDSIIIKINGQRRKTIGGDGYSISGPLRR